MSLKGLGLAIDVDMCAVSPYPEESFKRLAVQSALCQTWLCNSVLLKTLVDATWPFRSCEELHKASTTERFVANG